MNTAGLNGNRMVERLDECYQHLVMLMGPFCQREDASGSVINAAINTAAENVDVARTLITEEDRRSD